MASYARFFVLSLLLALVATPAVAQNGDAPIVASDLFNLEQLGSVTVSPDGRHLAYTVTSIVEENGEENDYGYRTHLYLWEPQRDEAPRPLTRGEQNASQPAWHPDGDRLAFVRAVDDTPQIHILPVFGGEAYQVTDFEHGASNPTWSPDGSRLLFSASLSEATIREQTGENPPWPVERPGRAPNDAEAEEASPDGSAEEIRAWLEQNTEQNNPRVITRQNFQGEQDLQPQMQFQHFFILDIESEDTEPQQITHGYFSFGGGEWLRNGRQVIVSGALDEETHPDRVLDSNLYLVDIEGGEPRLLLDIEDYAVRAPRVSPDGRTVAFLASDLQNLGFAQNEIGTFSLSGREAPRLLTTEFDRSAGSLTWSRDNWSIYYTAPTDGGFPLYQLSVVDAEGEAIGALEGSRSSFSLDEIDAPSAPIERLSSFERGIRSFDVSDATIYYVATDVTNPYELYAANTSLSNERQVSDHNESWLSERRLSVPREHVVEADSFEVQYWVMPPAGFDPDSDDGSFPVMLQIHGGPSAMWGPGEDSMWHEFQLMAARGFGVVYSNPRGSGGYGNAFRRANFQDWGDGPTDDVLAALDDALERYSWLDAEQQVVTGGSYAGYLTAWIVGQTDRFEAALAQRGVYDLPTFLGEGNAWRLVPNHFGGFPWETERPELPDDEEELRGLAADTLSAAEILRYNSPLTYVDQITTPLLIMHGDNDLRTGVIQSEVLYKSLKILERPVEYVRYPNAGHELSRSGDPAQRIDRLLRIYEFMDRYVELDPLLEPSVAAEEEPAEAADIGELFDVPAIPEQATPNN